MRLNITCFVIFLSFLISVASASEPSAADLLSKVFKSVSVSNHVISITTNDSGVRYLILKNQFGSKITSYNETVQLDPSAELFSFKERHSSIIFSRQVAISGDLFYQIVAKFDGSSFADQGMESSIVVRVLDNSLVTIPDSEVQKLGLSFSYKTNVDSPENSIPDSSEIKKDSDSKLGPKERKDSGIEDFNKSNNLKFRIAIFSCCFLIIALIVFLKFKPK